VTADAPIAEPRISARTILPQSFFAQPVAVVARDLLGRYLVRERGTPSEVVLRITETEAYGGQDDSASHCRAGRTARNAPMWGPPGHAYVYVCYGLHQMLNIVTGREGEGEAVLVRSCETVSGEAIVRARRGDRVGLGVTAGPGNVGAALALDRGFSGAPLFVEGALEAHVGAAVADVSIGRRIGVDYASASDRAARLRFAITGSPAITHARSLRRARAARG
jgi:DNA-3-methyladenine glycosylase